VFETLLSFESARSIITGLLSSALHKKLSAGNPKRLEELFAKALKNALSDLKTEVRDQLWDVFGSSKLGDKVFAFEKYRVPIPHDFL